MEKAFTIKYHWNLADYPNLSFEQKEKLEQEAEKTILEQRQEGCTQGELIYEDNEISIYGWWEFSYIAS